MPSEAVFVAIIGLAGILLTFALKDVMLRVWQERVARRRTLLQLRLERAYTPLDHLAFLLLQEAQEEDKQRYIDEISAIVRQYGHLLSTETLSAFYTLMTDLNTGAALLQQSFSTEYEHLVAAYYRSYHSVRDAQAQPSA